MAQWLSKGDSLKSLQARQDPKIRLTICIKELSYVPPRREKKDTTKNADHCLKLQLLISCMSKSLEDKQNTAQELNSAPTGLVTKI